MREHDKDRYLATLYAPETARPQLFALYAFDNELARIPKLVSEPQIGEIRFQWWRDTVSAIYRGNALDHPIASALAEAVRHGHLPEHALQDMIDAQSERLHDEVPEDISRLELHLGKMFSTPIQLASLLLKHSSTEAAGLAGVAYGIAKLGLKNEGLADHAMGRLEEARRIPLPRDVLPAFLPVSLVPAYLTSRSGEISPLRRQFTIWNAARRNRF
jgi:phytoene/squalene synthetase